MYELESDCERVWASYAQAMASIDAAIDHRIGFEQWRWRYLGGQKGEKQTRTAISNILKKHIEQICEDPTKHEQMLSSIET